MKKNILLKVPRTVSNWSERVYIGPRTTQTKFGNHCISMSRTDVTNIPKCSNVFPVFGTWGQVLAVFECWEASILFFKIVVKVFPIPPINNPPEYQLSVSSTIPWCEVTVYLTRHIYVDHNSGDRNYGGTKIWGFFS